MLIDREQFLTQNSASDGTIAGQAFSPNDGVADYGDSEYDLKAAGHNPAVGSSLSAYIMTTVDAATATNIIVSVGSASAAAGTNYAALVTRTFALAELTVALGVYKIGTLNTQGIPAGNDLLLACITPSGANLTAGTFKIWLQKDSDDSSPHNAANKI